VISVLAIEAQEQQADLHFVGQPFVAAAAFSQDAEKGSGRLNACPTHTCKLLIVCCGAGGFACHLW
jgi:hypothetical protein